IGQGRGRRGRFRGRAPLSLDLAASEDLPRREPRPAGPAVVSADRLSTGSRRIISVDSSGKVESIETEDARTTRERLRSLAWLLDSSIPIPGTRLTIGLD